MLLQESPVVKGGLLTEQPGRASSARVRKKILFVTKTNEYGGAEVHLLRLIRSLRDGDVPMSLLCVENDVFSERVAPNQRVEVVRCNRAPSSFRDWVALFRELQPGVDAAVFIYSWLWWFPVSAHIAARVAGIRKLFAIQHALPPPAPPKVKGRSFRDVLRRLIGKRARHVLRATMTPNLWSKTICVSDAVRGGLIRDYRFPPERTMTVHNGVSLTEFAPSSTDGIAVRKRLCLEPDEFVLCCAARLTEHKGVDVLLRGLAQAVHQGVPCKCILLGDGPQRQQLLEQARKMNVLDHVFFEGFQNDIRPYLHASSAFILTSHTEGGPLCILEAMACGLPCIVTAVGGSVEAITDQVNGLIIPPASPGAVADAISYLVAHPEKRQQMARAARTTACELFNLDDRMAELKRAILD
jgi:glycosyltransferase involved in cell wall biosynthesis